MLLEPVQPHVTKKPTWRQRATTAFYAAGQDKVARDLENCERDFTVKICEKNIDHAPQIIPFTCKKRFCPECEHRESARKLRRYYKPILNMQRQHKHGYRLRKMVLTTPYALESLSAATYAVVWDALRRFLDLWFFRQLDGLGRLSKAEKRRGRVNLKKHGIGALVSAEFGEIGKKLHFHATMYCPWMEWEDIINLWKEVTGGVCEVARINGIKAHEIEKNIKEHVKYITKFSELDPALVPHLASVLKGNRRFRTYGLLNGIKLPKDDELPDCGCPTCGATRRIVSISTYIRICVALDLSPDDDIIDRAEKNFLSFSSELEISLGKHPHRARDSIEGD